MDVQQIQPAPGLRPPEPVGLAPGRRVIATVLALEGNRALLEIGPVHLVARLADPGLSAQLAGRDRIAVIIRSLTPHQAVLQLAADEVGQAAPQTTGLAARLAELGLPSDAPYPQIVAELLTAGLPLTAERVRMVRAQLEALGEWTGEDLRVIARLLALNLPVTAETIALARAAEVGPPLAELLSNLRADLQELVHSLGEDTPFAQALAALANQAWEISMGAGQPAATPASQVGAWLHAIGTPIERYLALTALQETLSQLPADAEGRAAALRPYLGLSPALDTAILALLSEPASDRSAVGLADLIGQVARLIGELGDGGALPVLGRLRRLLRQPPPALTAPLRAAWARTALRTDVLVRTLRWTHLQNVGRSGVGGEGGQEPRAVMLPLALSDAEGWLSGQVRLVCHQRLGTAEGTDARTTDEPSYARLLVRADLGEAEAVAVDLILIEHQIDCRVRTLGAGAHGRAEASLPELVAGLERLGFNVAAGCEPLPVNGRTEASTPPFTCDVHA